MIYYLAQIQIILRLNTLNFDTSFRILVFVYNILNPNSWPEANTKNESIP